MKIEASVNRKMFWFLTFVVALVGFGTYYYFSKENIMQLSQNELGNCNTPEEAYQKTQEALNLLSTNINSGIENAHYISEYETTKNKVFKNK